MSRKKGVSIEKPILYGSISHPILKKEPGVDPSHTHKWTVFVKSANDADPLENYVKKVVFKLHDSFAAPTRSI